MCHGPNFAICDPKSPKNSDFQSNFASVLSDFCSKLAILDLVLPCVSFMGNAPLISPTACIFPFFPSYCVARERAVSRALGAKMPWPGYKHVQVGGILYLYPKKLRLPSMAAQECPPYFAPNMQPRGVADLLRFGASPAHGFQLLL